MTLVHEMHQVKVKDTRERFLLLETHWKTHSELQLLNNV